MQNKPNLLAVSRIPKMNITSAITVNYINELRTTNYELIMKNKPNQSQFVFFTAEIAELAEFLLPEDLCQCNWIKRNYLAKVLFPLTLSTVPDYNEIFILISCFQRTPNERIWK